MVATAAIITVAIVMAFIIISILPSTSINEVHQMPAMALLALITVMAMTDYGKRSGGLLGHWVENSARYGSKVIEWFAFLSIFVSTFDVFGGCWLLFCNIISNWIVSFFFFFCICFKKLFWRVYDCIALRCLSFYFYYFLFFSIISFIFLLFS